jgi:hypothetical protein
MGFMDEVAFQLETDGVGVRQTNIFGSSFKVLPKGSGPFLSIIETGGSSPDNTHNSTDRPAYRRPGAMIVVRADTVAAAKMMIEAAYDSLVKIRNQTIDTSESSAWYRRINVLQEPNDTLGLDNTGRVRYSFNISADKRPSITSGSDIVGMYLLDFLAGTRNAFVRPASVDAYPVGALYSALVPGSAPTVISALPTTGNIVFEASSSVESAGARAKVALFDLDADEMVDNSELTFSSGETIGGRARSSAITLIAGGRYGAKMTTDNTAVGCAAWDIKIIHL